MPFKKGQSGNPGGQPRGLQRLVREMLGRVGWTEVVRVQYQIATGQYPESAPKDMTAAAKWLADRGFGQPAASVDVTSNGEAYAGVVTVVLDPGSMSDEQLAEVEARLEAAGSAVAADRPPSDEDLGGEGTIHVTSGGSVGPDPN